VFFRGSAENVKNFLEWKVWYLQCSEAKLWSLHFDTIYERGYQHINHY